MTSSETDFPEYKLNTFTSAISFEDLNTQFFEINLSTKDLFVKKELQNIENMMNLEGNDEIKKGLSLYFETNKIPEGKTLKDIETEFISDYANGYLNGFIHAQFIKYKPENIPVRLTYDYTPYNNNFYYQAVINGANIVSESEEGTTDRYYLFNNFWQPTTCSNSGDTTYQQCSINAKEYWKNNSTIHGLWPEYSDGSYPSYCTNEPFDPLIIKDVFQEKLNTLWPNIISTGKGDESYLWQHEWDKHGTCSGLSQRDYFSQILKAQVEYVTPEFVKNNIGKETDSPKLFESYEGNKKVLLLCENVNMLNEIRICLSQKDGFLNERIECPENIQNQSTCTQSTTIINAWPENT
jgi:ribonuclease T2